jgi:hypothetical protein
MPSPSPAAHRPLIERRNRLKRKLFSRPRLDGSSPGTPQTSKRSPTRDSLATEESNVLTEIRMPNLCSVCISGSE